MQVTSSSDLLQWSPFELLTISGLDLSIPAAAAEVYFIHVQTNPVHRRTLLGVMPIVHRGLGCLALALSTDGARPATSAAGQAVARLRQNPARLGRFRFGPARSPVRLSRPARFTHPTHPPAHPHSAPHHFPPPP